MFGLRTESHRGQVRETGMNRYFNKQAAKQQRKVSRKCRRIEQKRAQDRACEEKRMMERNKARYALAGQQDRSE